MPKYKLELSKKFYIDGVIEEVDNIDWILDRCKDHREEIYFLLLFLTGARPSEILLLNTDSIYRDHNYLIIHYKKTLKNGRARKLYRKLRGNGVYVQYAQRLLSLINNNYLEGQQIFGSSKWKLEHAKYIVRKRTMLNGKPVYNSYFFRHHHHSLLSSRGAKIQHIQYNKGAKDVKSVQPYLHINKLEQSEIGNFLLERKKGRVPGDYL